MIDKKDFHYDLPEALIAQHPLDRRDQSRLLVLQGDSKPTHHVFTDMPYLLRVGDCLVVNNTRVMPARLSGARRDSGTLVEFLLLKRLNQTDWEVIVRPGRRVRTGHVIDFLPDELSAVVLDVLPDGNRVVRFSFQGIWEEILERAGTMPLPPYIHEQLADKERYQTVYASRVGSAAAPTAGLHFTPGLLQQLRHKGIRIAELTLNVGLGTFRPVKAQNILDHHMHAEYYEFPQEAADCINETRRQGGRIISVGTTSCRVLETVAGLQMDPDHPEQGIQELHAESGWTNIFIYPGYTFKIIDGLITNFHLPESTLLMLVSALMGRERILAAYHMAVDQQYRFFSFGDAMLLIPDRKENPL